MSYYLNPVTKATYGNRSDTVQHGRKDIEGEGDGGSHCILRQEAESDEF